MPLEEDNSCLSAYSRVKWNGEDGDDTLDNTSGPVVFLAIDVQGVSLATTDPSPTIIIIRVEDINTIVSRSDGFICQYAGGNPCEGSQSYIAERKSNYVTFAMDGG